MTTDVDTLIGVAQALEQKRALAILADIAAMGDFFKDSDAFRAGWDSACDEIGERLRTEVWSQSMRQRHMTKPPPQRAAPRNNTSNEPPR